MAAKAATHAIRFLGNTHTHIKRRKRVVVHFHSNLKPLVEEAEQFKTLCLCYWAKNSKEHVDAVRMLGKTSSSRGQKLQFFRQGCLYTYSQVSHGGGTF